MSRERRRRCCRDERNRISSRERRRRFCKDERNWISSRESKRRFWADARNRILSRESKRNFGETPRTSFHMNSRYPQYYTSCKLRFAQINFASLIISFFATSAFFHFLALVLGAFEVCWFWYWRCARPTCPGLSRAADSASLALAGSWTTRSRGGAGPRRRAFEPFSKKPIRSRVHPTPFSVFNFCFNHGEFVVAFEPQVVSSSCSPQSYLCGIAFRVGRDNDDFVKTREIGFWVHG